MVLNVQATFDPQVSQIKQDSVPQYTPEYGLITSEWDVSFQRIPYGKLTDMFGNIHPDSDSGSQSD